ncbi:hypothetical protein Ancab_003327 [Ancistrocladus abbreviatus]
MLVPMAADQRKRRLNGPIGFGYREQHKAKKKNSGSLQHDLNLNPHVSHKWDENEKRLVPRGEQIGISWRHLTSVASVPRDKTVLADVLTLPKDVFNLKKLMEILSYGAWESFLTEQERNYLMQFLPGGVEPEQVVQSLLAGDNFHFGNPLLQWGTSLCSGDLHPDAVLRHERSFRANKKAYYSELQKYHNNMIDNLQKLKERCARSKDPETEFLMFRSGGKDVGKDKTEKSEVSSDELKSVSRTKKGERLQKDNFNCGDGAKYMSYVKISKKQHDLVKSMKQSGNSIQSRTLNRVLGNLDNFQVKPYEMFEKEEQNRILEYWSNLANNDLPLAFAKWRKNQSERLQIITSLWQEMDEKLKFLVEDEENENSDGILQNQPHDEGAAAQSSSDDDMDSDLSSVEDHSSQVHSLNVEQDINPMDLNAEDNLGALEESEYHVASGSVEASENLPQCPESDSPINPVQTEELPCSSAMDAWPSAGIADSYCQPSSASIEYTSSNELSLRHPQVVQEHSAHLIGLESNMPVEDLTKDLLHQQRSDMSFFRSYQNQERNELLHSFIKPEDYHEEHRRTGLDFHPTPNMVMESGQFLSGLSGSSCSRHPQWSIGRKVRVVFTCINAFRRTSSLIIVDTPLQGKNISPLVVYETGVIAARLFLLS